jgi:acetyltransferase-like isoleucine patch superfamily enzyme
MLKLKGGLVRIGNNALLDCMGENGISLGRNFRLGDYSRIIVSGTLSNIGSGVIVGDNVGIGEFAYIGGAGGVEIGANTIVGQYFSVHPENHIYSDQNLLIRMQGIKRVGIKIGEDCWLGSKTTILDGVNLGSRCVVAAGSVVTKSFPSGSVIGGVPARVIEKKNLNRHRYLEEFQNK